MTSQLVRRRRWTPGSRRPSRTARGRRLQRVDPQRLVVAVNAAADCSRSYGRRRWICCRPPESDQTTSAVAWGRRTDVAVVEGAEVDVRGLVADHAPGGAPVVGAEQRPLGGRLGHHVDGARVALSHGHADAGHRLVDDLELVPAVAAVFGACRAPSPCRRRPRSARACGGRSTCPRTGSRGLLTGPCRGRSSRWSWSIVRAPESQLVPPSVVRKTPRSSLSPHSWPDGAQTKADIGVARVHADALDALAVHRARGATR